MHRRETKGVEPTVGQWPAGCDFGRGGIRPSSNLPPRDSCIRAPLVDGPRLPSRPAVGGPPTMSRRDLLHVSMKLALSPDETCSKSRRDLEQVPSGLAPSPDETCSMSRRDLVHASTGLAPGVRRRTLHSIYETVSPLSGCPRRRASRYVRCTFPASTVADRRSRSRYGRPDTTYRPSAGTGTAPLRPSTPRR